MSEMWEFLRRNAGPILGIGVFVLMLALNLMTPTWGDDWHRTLPGGDIGTVVKRIVWEYQTWTGRVSVLLLTYLFLWQYPGGLLVFDVLNAVVFCALVVGIFALASGRMPTRSARDAITLFLLLVAVWFFVDAFGETVLWKTGAIGFLWVATATLFAVKPFVDLLCDEPVIADSRARKWLLPSGYFLLGMGLENVSAATVALFVGTLVVCRCLGRRIPRWYLRCTLAYMAGTLVLVAAPGNFERYAMQADGEPMYVRLLPLVRRIWDQGTETTGAFIAILVALIAAAVVVRSPSELRRFAVLLLFGMLIALAMIGSTGVAFGGRTAFCAEVLFVSALGALAFVIPGRGIDSRVTLPFLGLVAAVWASDALKTLEQYYSTYLQTERRAELMAMYRQHGVRVALLPSYQVPHISGLHDDLVRGRYFLRDIHGDTPGNGWRNGTFAEDNGFEFALRLDKPYVLYAPELSENPAFKTLLREGAFWLLSRAERTGPGGEASYLLASQGECEAAAAKIPGYQWNFGDTVLIEESGKPSDARCVARGMPQAS